MGDLSLEYFLPGFALALVFLVCICNPCGKGVDVAQRGYTLLHNRVGKKCALCYKWCLIFIFIPLYFVTIVMSVYIFAGDVGMTIIDDMCAETGQECKEFFSFGLAYHDDSACEEPLSCTDSDLLAKAGSSHAEYPTFGLGKDLSPTSEDVTMLCVDFQTNCEAANSSTGVFFDNLALLCEDGTCLEWASFFDDSKPDSFSYINCTCQDENATKCVSWDCTVDTYEYFYPNVLFTLLVGILFVWPILALMALDTKIQCTKKLCPCAHPQVYVFQQGGGFISTTAADLATGGHHVNLADRDKNLGVRARSFQRQDCALYIFGTLSVCVLGYFMCVAAGFIGFAILMLVILSIPISLLAWYLCYYRPNLSLSVKTKVRKAQQLP